MAKKDRRIDAYIASAAPFAQKILKHLRKLVHAGCPEVEETISGRTNAATAGMSHGAGLSRLHSMCGPLKLLSSHLISAGKNPEPRNRTRKLLRNIHMQRLARARRACK